jgi:hypothetical protein
LNDSGVGRPGRVQAVTVAAPWEQLQAEAVAIVTAAAAQGVTLRVVGSAGIRLHCPAPGPLMDRLGRPAKDIDFIVPRQHRKGMRRLLESRGYIIDRDLLIAMEGARYSFEHPGDGIQIDVFVERLDFCHTIEVSGRLDRHPVTLPIEELLLSKLQVVEMTTTDRIDAAVLLATHEVSHDAGGSDAPRQPVAGETVDVGYIAGLLSRDWGFHHTATRNLERLRHPSGSGAVPGMADDETARLQRRAGQLLDAIEAAPKSVAWRMRARVGERKQWWQDVDDRRATY